MPEEFEPVVYVCKKYPGFSFKGTNRWFRFEKHQLTLKNQDDVDDMDMHLEKYPNIKMHVAKVDLAQAEALVLAHIKSHGGAMQGPFTAAHGNQGELNDIAKRDAAMAAMSPQQETDLRKNLEVDSNLMTTVPTQPVKQASGPAKTGALAKPVTPTTPAAPLITKPKIVLNK